MAKRLDGESSLTLTGQVLGSPNFMPPEQAGSGHGKVGRYSDVYGLGAILYFLLTARPPFQADSLEGIVTQVLHSEPLALRALNPSVPRDLETICLKCLTKEPHKRYATASHLAAELGRFLKDEPIQARPATPFERVWRWCRRNPKTALLSAVVALLLVTVASGSTLAAIRINRAERTATEKLFDSYIAQARAVRHNNREGQRSESLAAVVKAAAIHASPELRDEAIACLAVMDVRFAHVQTSTDPEAEYWDSTLELRAVRQPDGSISVRQVPDNREAARLPSLGVEPLGFNGFGGGGRYLAVQYTDGRTVIWDLSQQQPIINGVPGGWCADFSTDGQTVVISCQDGLIRRFTLNPVRELGSLALHRSFRNLHLRPQGDWFAGCNPLRDTAVEVHDVRDGSLLRTIAQPSTIGSIAWSLDGTYLAVGCENGRIFVWNAATGKKWNEFQAHQDTVTSIGFSHSGWLLGSTSWDRECHLWDLASGRMVLTAMGWSYQLFFSADDRRMGRVQRGRDTGSLELIPSSIFRRYHCQPFSSRGAFSTDVSLDGQLVAAAYSEGVRIWTLQQPKEPFGLPAGPCYSVIFTPDGTNLITCGPSGLALWPIHHAISLTTDELHLGPRQSLQDGLEFNYAALSKDGRWVAAAQPAAAAVSIYEVRHPTNRFSLVSQPHAQFPAISPNGRWVAVGNWKGSGVKVWELASRQLVCDLPAPSTAWVTFSPDNRWLATTGGDCELWETGSWKRRQMLHQTHAAGPMALAFSPDARTLAIAIEPGMIRLLVTETGEVLANLEGPGDAIMSSLRFSSDGSQLFALEWDQQIQVWDLRRIRAELRKLRLDWKAPPLPAEPTPTGPVRKTLQLFLDEQIR